MNAVDWCDDRGCIPALVEFFVANVDHDYISHGELIDGRAEAVGKWSTNLRDVLAAEFAQCDFEGVAAAGKRLAVMTRDDATLALALVELAGEDAFLHDLVVMSEERGHGAGATMLEWIEDAVSDAGCRRLFLESGVANGGAHRFFERAGYAVVSQVMLKALKR